jgi:hypothetical protein
MDRLVQGIQRQPAPGVADSGLVLTLISVTAYQSLKSGGQFLAQAFGLEELPLVEVGTVAQGKPFQKVSPVQLDRLSQVGQTSGTDFSLRMAVALPVLQQPSEMINV